MGWYDLLQNRYKKSNKISRLILYKYFIRGLLVDIAPPRAVAAPPYRSAAGGGYASQWWGGRVVK